MSNINVIKSRSEIPATDVSTKNKFGDPICYGKPTVVKANDTREETDEAMTDKHVSDSKLSQAESNEPDDHQPEIVCAELPTLKTPTFDELFCIVEKPSLTKPSTSIEKPGQGVTEMNRNASQKAVSHEDKQLNFKNEKTKSTDLSNEKKPVINEVKPLIFDDDVKGEIAVNDATSTECTIINKETTTTMKQELVSKPLNSRDESILIASREMKTIRLNSTTSLIPVPNSQSINKLR